MSAPQLQIAVIFDFDDTLADDSTAAFVESLGEDPQKFYDEVSKRVTDGWDPPLAYLTLLCDRVREGKFRKLKRSDFVAFGKKLKLYPGVGDCLKGVRKKFESDKLIKEAELSLEYYIVSGGVGDIVRSVSISNMFKEIWACEMDYGKDGIVSRPKASISFTEKTKYLYYINKGIDRITSRTTPYAVNVVLESQNRPVPFSHMIYVGDGPSDVPCMSLLKNADPPGRPILVVGPKKVHKAWELLERGTPVHRDYRRSGMAREFLETAVMNVGRAVAEKIVEQKRQTFSKKVGY